MPSTMQKYKTCERWNEPGDGHELTFSCFHRYPLLSKDRTRIWLIRAIERARVKHEFDVWAYVIMPEHVHLLIRPRRALYDMSAILKAIKWPVAMLALRFLSANAPQWLEKLTDRQPSGRTAVRF